MDASHRPVSKTRSFSTIFLIEMWERFGFYGLQALIIFYMVQQLKLPDTTANLTWGAAMVLMYVAPVAGGWVGDKFFGTRRTMLLGAVILTLGYALMIIPSNNIHFFFLVLGVIIAGSGLFKANSANLVRFVYANDVTRIDSAATIYYMSVNVGAMISMLITPVIKSYFASPFHGQLTWLLGNNAHQFFGSGFGWHVAFSASCIGLLVGLGNYMVMRSTLRHIGSAPDQQPLRLWKLITVLGGTIAAVFASAVIINYTEVAMAFVYGAIVCSVVIYAYVMRTCEEEERPGVIIAILLVLEFTFFFMFNAQNATSLSLFALRNIDLSFNVFGFHLWTWDPAQLQAFNSIWIVVLSPLLAILYTHYAKRGSDTSIATKFTLGYVAIAIGFFIYAAGGQFAASHGKATSWTIIWGYGFQSLGELLTSALGLAFIARYVPARVSGVLIGVNLVVSGVVGFFGTMVASLASIPDSVAAISRSGSLVLVPAVRHAVPGILQMKLSSFRGWLAGATQGTHLAKHFGVPAFAALPSQTQELVRKFDTEISLATMPHYTHLFFWLGVAGIGCALVTAAALPFIRRMEGTIARAAVQPRGG